MRICNTFLLGLVDYCIIWVKLKNLNMLMTITLYFVFSCKDVVDRVAEAFSRITCFKNRDWSKLRQFVHYRLC